MVDAINEVFHCYLAVRELAAVYLVKMVPHVVKAKFRLNW